MKSFRSPILALGACLVATIAFAAESLAQAKEDPFDAGIAAYQSNDLLLAFKKFREAAVAGHADSQFNVALMYEQGIGVEAASRRARPPGAPA